MGSRKDFSDNTAHDDEFCIGHPFVKCEGKIKAPSRQPRTGIETGCHDFFNVHAGIYPAPTHMIFVSASAFAIRNGVIWPISDMSMI